MPDGLQFEPSVVTSTASNNPTRRGEDMRIAIVYDSRTGTTKGAAEQMAQMALAAGHQATPVAVQAASASDVSAADAVCIDRKSVGEGKRVDLGGRRIIKTKNDRD